MSPAIVRNLRGRRVKMKFIHEFEEDINSGVLYTENFVTSGEKLNLRSLEDGMIALTGNREGLRKLAKLLIEMSFREDDDFHFHAASDFKLKSHSQKKEVLIGIEE